jgi:hypothetical protein
MNVIVFVVEGLVTLFNVTDYNIPVDNSDSVNVIMYVTNEHIIF